MTPKFTHPIDISILNSRSLFSNTHRTLLFGYSTDITSQHIQSQVHLSLKLDLSAVLSISIKGFTSHSVSRDCHPILHLSPLQSCSVVGLHSPQIPHFRSSSSHSQTPVVNSASTMYFCSSFSQLVLSQGDFASWRTSDNI